MPPLPEVCPLLRQLRHVLLLLLVVLPLTVAVPAQAQDSVATDKAALVALYNATDGTNWTPNTNWTSDMALSSWHGVTTNSAGRVTRLELNDNGLAGTLPAALGDLSELEQLEFTEQRPERCPPGRAGGPDQPRRAAAHREPGLDRTAAGRAARAVRPGNGEHRQDRTLRAGR